MDPLDPLLGGSYGGFGSAPEPSYAHQGGNVYADGTPRAFRASIPRASSAPPPELGRKKSKKEGPSKLQLLAKAVLKDLGEIGGSRWNAPNADLERLNAERRVLQDASERTQREMAEMQKQREKMAKHIDRMPQHDPEAQHAMNELDHRYRELMLEHEQLARRRQDVNAQRDSAARETEMLNQQRDREMQAERARQQREMQERQMREQLERRNRFQPERDERVFPNGLRDGGMHGMRGEQERFRDLGRDPYFDPYSDLANDPLMQQVPMRDDPLSAVYSRESLRRNQPPPLHAPRRTQSFHQNERAGFSNNFGQRLGQRLGLLQQQQQQQHGNPFLPQDGRAELEQRRQEQERVMRLRQEMQGRPREEQEQMIREFQMRERLARMKPEERQRLLRQQEAERLRRGFGAGTAGHGRSSFDEPRFGGQARGGYGGQQAAYGNRQPAYGNRQGPYEEPSSPPFGFPPGDPLDGPVGGGQQPFRSSVNGRSWGETSGFPGMDRRASVGGGRSAFAAPSTTGPSRLDALRRASQDGSSAQQSMPGAYPAGQPGGNPDVMRAFENVGVLPPRDPTATNAPAVPRGTPIMTADPLLGGRAASAAPAGFGRGPAQRSAMSSPFMGHRNGSGMRSASPALPSLDPLAGPSNDLFGMGRSGSAGDPLRQSSFGNGVNSNLERMKREEAETQKRLKEAEARLMAQEQDIERRQRELQQAQVSFGAAFKAKEKEKEAFESMGQAGGKAADQILREVASLLSPRDFKILTLPEEERERALDQMPVAERDGMLERFKMLTAEEMEAVRDYADGANAAHASRQFNMASSASPPPRTNFQSTSAAAGFAPSPPISPRRDGGGVSNSPHVRHVQVPERNFATNNAPRVWTPREETPFTGSISFGKPAASAPSGFVFGKPVSNNVPTMQFGKPVSPTKQTSTAPPTPVTAQPAKTAAPAPVKAAAEPVKPKAEAAPKQKVEKKAAEAANGVKVPPGGFPEPAGPPPSASAPVQAPPGGFPEPAGPPSSAVPAISSTAGGFPEPAGPPPPVAAPPKNAGAGKTKDAPDAANSESKQKEGGKGKSGGKAETKSESKDKAAESAAAPLIKEDAPKTKAKGEGKKKDKPAEPPKDAAPAKPGEPAAPAPKAQPPFASPKEPPPPSSAPPPDLRGWLVHEEGDPMPARPVRDWLTHIVHVPKPPILLDQLTEDQVNARLAAEARVISEKAARVGANGIVNLRYTETDMGTLTLETDAVILA